MVLVGRIRVQNLAPLQRSDVVNTVLSLPDGAIHSNNSTFELTALNAGAVAGRVQWHTMGVNYASGFRKYLRIYFKCDLIASEVKTVEIHDTATPATAWILHPAVRAQLAQSFMVITLGGYSRLENYKFKYGPHPFQGTALLHLPIRFVTAANHADYIIDQWKDPDNCLVRRYKFTTRGGPVGSFGYYFWAEIVLEIGSNQRHIKAFLRYGNSIITADVPIAQANTLTYINPVLYLYNSALLGNAKEIGYSGSIDITGGLAPQDQGVFMNVEGPQIVIRHPNHKVIRDDTTATNNCTTFHNLHRLIDPNSTLYQRPYSFCDGQSQALRLSFLFWNDTPTAAETSTLHAEYFDQTFAVSRDWVTNQNFGFLNVVATIPNNLTQDAAFDLCSAMAVFHYNRSMNIQGMTPCPWYPLSIYFDSNYSGVAFQGQTGSQPDFAWVTKLWPYIVSACTDLRNAQYCADLQACRPIFFKEADVSRFTVANHRSIESGIGRYCDVFGWGGRPYQDWTRPYVREYNEDLLGKAGEVGQFETANETVGPPYEHGSYNNLYSYFLLTGDWLAWSLILDLQQIYLTMYQNAGMGGTRPAGGAIDNLNAVRAFARGTISFYTLYDLTGDMDCFNRPLSNFRAYVRDAITFFKHPSLTKVRTLSIGGVSARCNDAVWACNDGEVISCTMWQDAMLPIGLWYIWKATADAVVLDRLIEFTRANNYQAWTEGKYVTSGFQTCRMTPTKFFGICWEYIDQASRLKGYYEWRLPVYNLWYLIKYQAWTPPGLTAGDLVPKAMYNDCAIIDINSEAGIWGEGGLVIGYELARMINDSEWAAHCARILNTDSYSPDVWGLGRFPGEHPLEWLGFIINPFKVREAGSSEFFVSFSGNSGNLGGTVLTVDSLGLSVNFSGNIGSIEGNLTVVTSGGGHFVELSLWNPNGITYYIGTGDMSGSVLRSIATSEIVIGIGMGIPKPLTAIAQGNVGNLFAALTVSQQTNPLIDFGIKYSTSSFRYAYDTSVLKEASLNINYAYTVEDSWEENVTRPYVGFKAPATQAIVNNLPQWMEIRKNRSSTGWKFINSWGQNLEATIEYASDSIADVFLKTSDTFKRSKLYYTDITDPEVLDDRTFTNLLFNSAFSIRDCSRTKLPMGWFDNLEDSQVAELDTTKSLAGSNSIKVSSSCVISQSGMLNNISSNSMTASIYVLSKQLEELAETESAEDTTIMLRLTIEKIDGSSVSKEEVLTKTSDYWQRIQLTLPINSQAYRYYFSVKVIGDNEVNLACACLENSTVASNWNKSEKDLAFYISSISNFGLVHVYTSNQEQQKITVFPLSDIESFRDIVIPTRVEKFPGNSRDLAVASYNTYSRQVDYFNNSYMSDWVIEDNSVVQRSSDLKFDRFGKYSIRDIRYYPNDVIGTADAKDTTITPLCCAVRGKYLFVVCSESYRGSTYTTLKVVIPQVPPGETAYLESVIDFDLNPPTANTYSIDQIEEKITSIAFSESEPNWFVLNTNLGSVIPYRLYFDYYYFDSNRNRMYLLENYKTDMGKIQVL